MNHRPDSDELRSGAPELQDDLLGHACSPEFPQGCAEPAEDMRAVVRPDAAPAPRKSDPGAASAAVPDEVAEVPDADPAAPAPDAPEIACSAEFPKGCVDAEA